MKYYDESIRISRITINELNGNRTDMISSSALIHMLHGEFSFFESIDTEI